MSPPDKIHRLSEGVYVAITDRGCELLGNDEAIGMLVLKISLDHGAIGKLVNLVRHGLGRKVHLRSDAIYESRKLPSCKTGGRSNKAKLLSTGWLMTNLEEEITCGNCFKYRRRTENTHE